MISRSYETLQRAGVHDLQHVCGENNLESEMQLQKRLIGPSEQNGNLGGRLERLTRSENWGASGEASPLPASSAAVQTLAP